MRNLWADVAKLLTSTASHNPNSGGSLDSGVSADAGIAGLIARSRALGGVAASLAPWQHQDSASVSAPATAVLTTATAVSVPAAPAISVEAALASSSGVATQASKKNVVQPLRLELNKGDAHDLIDGLKRAVVLLKASADG